MSTDPLAPSAGRDLLAPPPEAPEAELQDPLLRLSRRLQQPEAPEQLGALSREELLEVSRHALRAAGDAPSAAALDGLLVLRRACLLGNQREILGLVLRGMGEVAEATGDLEVATEAWDKLGGLMELVGRPARAHEAWLDLARVQEQAEQPEAAERTLMHAVTVARGMATGVGREEQLAAAERVGRTLRQLGTLLINQGRLAEGQAWLEGAEDFTR